MSKYRTFIPVMKSNEQGGYTVSATSGVGHYRAFDGIKDGSSGESGAYRSSIAPSLPEYLTITFPEPKLIGRYTVYLGYAHTRYTNMRTWDFEGLVNGEWMLLHSGENPVQQSATLTFDFTPIEVEGVRIKCKTRYGTNSWGLDELEVFEYVIHDKILLLSDGQVKTCRENEQWLNINKGLSDISEQDYIDYGIDVGDLPNIDLSQSFTKKSFISKNSSLLGSGQVFQQTIDTNKYKIKKITIK